jgi:eukaryotic-like serine/threonine-protein kinase
MPTPTTNIDLFRVLSQSGLFTPARLESYHRAFDPVSPAPNPDAIIRKMIEDGTVTPFQARFLLAGRYKGFFIGKKYKLLANIGSGGMGEVYLAEHLLLHRLVAIKILKPAGNRSGPSGAIERFFREARAAATLRHANIAQLYDVDRDGSTPYMVMEFVDGASLHNVGSDHERLSISRAVNYTVQAARGLEHAHENGLIHRDIKPGNLILEREGTVKILDLGLARFQTDRSKNNNLTARYDDKSLMGTADFIAPEQTHDSSSVDGRADLYSLGCTFYFFLTGQAPFQDGSIAQKLLWHQLKPAPSVTDFRNDAPPKLLTVLNKMMAKDPTLRFQSAVEVVAALEPWLDSKLPPPPLSEMPKRTAASYQLGLVSEVPATKSGVPNSTIEETAFSFPSSSSRDGASRNTTISNNSNLAISSCNPGLSAQSKWGFLPRIKRRWVIFAAIQLLLLSATAFVTHSLNRYSNITSVEPGRKPSEVKPDFLDEDANIVFQGGGSTFIAELMNEWKREYLQQSGVGYKYEAVGSGIGKTGLIRGRYDFACTDAVMNEKDMQSTVAKNRNWLHIPLSLGGVVVAYHVPGLETNLRFSGPLLSAIYRKVVTRWNDPLILAENKGLVLPNREIQVVYRAESSGTTTIWTEYLTLADPEGWGKSIRMVDLHPSKLIGIRANGNEGVADTIKTTPDSIGYVDLNIAITKDLTIGTIRNASGNYLQPTLGSITRAAEEKVPSTDLKYSIVNAGGSGAYPIAGFTWAVFDADMLDRQKRQAIVDFLLWAIHDGQRKTNRLNCSPIPLNVQMMAEALLGRLSKK